MEQKKGNYDISADYARSLFLKEDQEKIINKFGLKADDKFIYLRFLSLTYRIERSSGLIQKSADIINYTDDNGHLTTLSIFDYLCGSRDTRKLSGEWISMQKMGHSFHTNLLEGESGWMAESAVFFSARQEQLKKAFEQLGGRKMPIGDISYIIDLSDELPIYFQFWDGDDEFPPKISFLWDANSEQYVHYETTYYIVDMVLRRIRELME